MDWESSSGKFSISISGEQARAVATPGQNDCAVATLASVREIAEQLDSISPSDMAEHLSEYGAWSDEELADHGANRLRVLWLACWDIVEHPEDFEGEHYAP